MGSWPHKVGAALLREKVPSGKIATFGMTIILMANPNALGKQKSWGVLGEITSPPLLMFL